MTDYVLLQEVDTSTHLHPPGMRVEVLKIEHGWATVRRVERRNCGGRYCRRRPDEDCDEQSFDVPVALIGEAGQA